MHAAAVEFDLRLPGCRSLKEKRATIKPIIEGARHRYSVAAAEVGAHDQWQRAQIAVAAVAGSARHLGDILDEVERFVWSFPDVEIIATERAWLDAEA